MDKDLIDCDVHQLASEARKWVDRHKNIKSETDALVKISRELVRQAREMLREHKNDRVTESENDLSKPVSVPGQ